MKYLKLFENFDQSEIDKICKKYNIKNYTINPDGSIDVDGHVWLVNKDLTKLPLKFNRISMAFNCSGNRLTSLEGVPKEVGGLFDCSDNNLTSLEGCPNYVGGSFDYSYNPISIIIDLFNIDGDYYSVNNYLDYQETYNFLRKDGKIVKHLLEEALKDFNEYYHKNVKFPNEIEEIESFGYTYI